MQKKILGLLILLGLLLRLFKLGYHDLWYDEVLAIRFSNHYHYIWNPPFFYAILHFWIKAFGQSEFSLRLPALIFSALSIPSIYLLGKKLFDSRIALFSAILMTLSPMQIWYAQEARPYSAVLFFTIASTYLLVMLIKGSPRYWPWFTLSSILGMLTGELYLFVLMGHLIIFIKHNPNKKEIRTLLISVLLMLACLLPWLNRYLIRFNGLKKGFWIPQPGPTSFMITLENFLGGYNLSQWQYFIASFLILTLLFIAVKSLYKNTSQRSSLYICIFLLVFPILSIYLFSKVFFSIYIDRALMMLSPCFYILLALGMKEISSKKIGLLVYPLLSFLFIVGIISFYKDLMPAPFKHHVGTYIKRPVRPLINFIHENSGPEDIIAFANHSTLPLFRHYSVKTRRYYKFFDPELLDTDWNRPIRESQYCIPKHKIMPLKARRIWLIASNWSHDGNLDDQSKSIKRFLDKEMSLEMSKNIDGSWVYLYKNEVSQ